MRGLIIAPALYVVVFHPYYGLQLLQSCRLDGVAEVEVILHCKPDVKCSLVGGEHHGIFESGDQQFVCKRVSGFLIIEDSIMLCRLKICRATP